MKTGTRLISFYLLGLLGGISVNFNVDSHAATLKIPANRMIILKDCRFNNETGFFTNTKDGSSVLLVDSVNFNDSSFFNTITAEMSLNYGEIYGQHSGELDLYLDNEATPFASVRIPLPVSWDKMYLISKEFKPITGKHQLKVVWDWYTANLKSITLSFDTTGINLPAKEIKIACLGNSITEGTEAGDRINCGYVGVLDQLLGKGYQVRNYGSSGATVCRNTYNSFSTGNFCASALAFQPDIVTISLGTNDSQIGVWNTGSYAANFESDYFYLIDLFANLESHPKIYLCLPPPIFPNKNWSHQPDVLANEIIPLIKKIADEKRLELIDFYTPMLEHNDYYAPTDQLHPLAPGHKLMAKLVYEKIKAR